MSYTVFAEPSKRSTMQLTTVIVAVFAVYVSYNGFSFVRQYWEHLRLGWDALQQLQELPQEHIDDFFEAYKRLSERTTFQLQ